MKTKLLILSWALFALSSCKLSSHLPKMSELGKYPYGAYIKVKGQSNHDISGELITAGDKELVIRDPNTGLCNVFAVKSIRKFKLYFALSDNAYIWPMPAYSIFAALHGYLGVFTIPINIIATSIIYGVSKTGFRYTEKNLPVNQLFLYARYPQGLPPNITLRDIR